MFKMFSLSAVLAIVLATSVSTTFAAPRHKNSTATNHSAYASERQGTSSPLNRTLPSSGAQWWQDKGNADDMGVVYRR